MRLPPEFGLRPLLEWSVARALAIAAATPQMIDVSPFFPCGGGETLGRRLIRTLNECRNVLFPIPRSTVWQILEQVQEYIIPKKQKK